MHSCTRTAATANFEEALQIKKSCLGAEHPEVAITLRYMADMYRVQGNLPAAESAYAASLAIFNERLGEEHQYTKEVDALLAEVRQKASSP